MSEISKGFEARVGLSDFVTAWPFIQRELVAPRKEFLDRPSKNFRSELVRLSFEVSSVKEFTAESFELYKKAGGLLEALHAGSLVVDDIQDDSLYRRGKETLHRIYGVPRAINVGNWLYFDALDSIADWGLPPQTECALWRLCHRALNRAHFGQGIDLGVAIDKVDREKIATLCLSSLELKTGALTELAFGLGAVLAEANPEARAHSQRFGREFGVALQMLDDLGNLQEKKVGGVADGKQFEDLRLRRPSWVWATAATHFDNEGFRKFVEAVERLPDTLGLAPLLGWLVPLGRESAERYLDAAVEDFRKAKVPVSARGEAAFEELIATVTRLKGAYVGKTN